MARKRYRAEEIIGHLRTIEIEMGKGWRSRLHVPDARDHGTELRDELLKGELLYVTGRHRSSLKAGSGRYHQVQP
jgi:hypothetical protein